MKIQYLIISCVFFLACGNCNTTKSNLDNPKRISRTLKESLELMRYKNCTELFNSPENYDSACSCIDKYKLVFPSEDVVSGVLYKNSEPEPSAWFTIGDTFQLDKQFIDDFRKITNDTANFIWGEPGTPYTDYIILFADSTGKIINKAEISFDNSLVTEPHLGTTKWGGISNKGLVKIKNLINKYI